MIKSLGKLLVINVLVLAGLYAAAEGIYSLYVYLTPSGSFWVGENSGQTVHFDPVMGFSLSQTPTRTLLITKGVIEHIGTLEGNAQGLPDRDDFTIKRPRPDYRRYVVFGDSFTAGQMYLSRNWPDRAEDIYKGKGRPVQLLNYSGDGWGLANWTSIVRGVLRKVPYEIDGLIFAVWNNDLDRRFAYTDFRGQNRRVDVAARSWNPATHPRSLEEAIKTLHGSGSPNSRIVSSDTFNEILKGKPVQRRKWVFILSKRLKEEVYWRAVSYISHLNDKNTRHMKSRQTNDAEKILLYDEIRDFAAQRNLPILVVYIWSREGLFGDDEPGEHPYLEKTRSFAKYIGGVFVDGREAFAGTTRDQLKKLWMPYNGHWGQGASDIFAKFMVYKIEVLRNLSDRSGAGQATKN